MTLTIKQKNYTEYLENINYKVSFSEDKIIFTCPEKHENTLTLNSFGNLKSKKNKFSMCVECNKVEENNIFKNEIQELSIHTILKVHNGKQIDFICGSCNIEGTSNKQSLIKSKSCGKCHNSLQRKDYEILKKEIENMGFTLVTKQYEYTNNKNITVLCICKNEWKCSLNDLSRGRKCMACKTERTYETNNIKYGCDNVFQNEKIKELSKQTLQQNHGVDYPQQSAAIREKTTETSLQRYGVKRAFCLPEDFHYNQNLFKKKLTKLF